MIHIGLKRKMIDIRLGRGIKIHNLIRIRVEGEIKIKIHILVGKEIKINIHIRVEREAKHTCYRRGDYGGGRDPKQSGRQREEKRLNSTAIALSEHAMKTFS